jgi:hypothetical protein
VTPKREALVSLIRDATAVAADAGKKLPAVPLDAFFDGNEDSASIGCNLDDHPGVPRFYEVLRQVKARPEVQDVMVAISEVMPEGEWPFADTVLVLTTASPAAVGGWVAELQATETRTAATEELPPGVPPRGPGVGVVYIWWD